MIITLKTLMVSLEAKKQLGYLSLDQYITMKPNMLDINFKSLLNTYRKKDKLTNINSAILKVDLTSFLKIPLTIDKFLHYGSLIVKMLRPIIGNGPNIQIIKQ